MNRGNDDEPGPLQGVKTDLEEVTKWLTGPEVGADAHAMQVECGFHGHNDVTKSSVERNLEILFRKQADVFFWFYSGHADEDFS